MSKIAFTKSTADARMVAAHFIIIVPLAVSGRSVYRHVASLSPQRNSVVAFASISAASFSPASMRSCSDGSSTLSAPSSSSCRNSCFHASSGRKREGVEFHERDGETPLGVREDMERFGVTVPN
jgi:hypothetical protein